MSNTRYYARRAAGLCPDCGVAVPEGVYCAQHRASRMAYITRERQADRAGYNLYMRIYKQQRRARTATTDREEA